MIFFGHVSAAGILELDHPEAAACAVSATGHWRPRAKARPRRLREEALRQAGHARRRLQLDWVTEDCFSEKLSLPAAWELQQRFNVGQGLSDLRSS
jgi:hypothetical protein